MTAPLPAEGPCERCAQPRPLFRHPGTSNDAGNPKQLCAQCWARIQDARDNGTYADWNDAFDHASDDEIAAYLNGSTR